MQKMDETNFMTEDYSLANWLVFNGVILLGTIQFPNETRKSFVFQSKPAINDLVEDWRVPTSETAIICKRFFSAHSHIKKELKDSLDVSEIS